MEINLLKNFSKFIDKSKDRLIDDNKISKCKKCGNTYKNKTLKDNLYICPHCENYFYMPPEERISLLIDEGSFKKNNLKIKSKNIIDFPLYNSKIEEAFKNSTIKEEVLFGSGKINGIEVVIACMDFNFMGGSMGKVVGEYIVSSFELALKKKIPLIIISSSGGARMQEGIFSLMQMAKTSQIVKKLNEAGIPYISIPVSPTTGGVLASFVMLGDIIISEPNAKIGFAGERVIENTLSKKNINIQTSEIFFENGMIDILTKREEMKAVIYNILSHLRKDNSKICNIIEKKEINFTNKENKILTDYEILKKARSKDRAIASDFIKELCDEFIELCGDRTEKNDKAIIGGLGRIENKNFVIVYNQKGRTLDEKIERNFSMSKASGYRKALRLFKLAERFNLPILTLIDTKGAYPDSEVDNISQSFCIANNLMEMSNLKTRIISVVIGEACSGGALALAISDKTFMLENSIYSVISPEGCASILFRNKDEVEKATNSLKISAKKLKKLGIIDDVIDEALSNHYNDIKCTCFNLKKVILNTIDELDKITIEKILENRYNKYRNI